VLLIVNVTPTFKNLEHPLDKIFGGILAGSSDFTHASVMHYNLQIILGEDMLTLMKQTIIGSIP